MSPGALASVFTDRPAPFDDFDAVTDRLVGKPEIPLALRYFGGAGLAHMEKYGTPLEAFARIRAKASRHAANNPLALFRKEVSARDVLDAPAIWPGVMTRLMACPPTCGAAAGLAQCFELTHQLRGTADARQVEGARTALQHNLGLGGACVVTLYQV